jgi:hypothetical protein
MSPDNNRGDPARPGVLRRIGRAALSPWLSLRIGERVATLRRDLDELRSGGRRAASRVRLDETGGSTLTPWRSCMDRGAGHLRRL